MTAIEDVADVQLIDLREESREVRDALSALGRLLGAALIEPPRNLASFVRAHLGVPPDKVAIVRAPLAGATAPLVFCEVGRLLAQAPDALLTDDSASGAPGYDLIDVDVDEQVAAPYDLAAALPARDGLGLDVVLVLGRRGKLSDISLHVRREDAARARLELAALLRRARVERNFYRGKTLRATATDWELILTPIPPFATTRDAVVHTPRIWAEIDANIGGLTRHGDTLRAGGLGTGRGVLIAGAPGVGKTALCRVIASELPRGTTIVTVDAAITPYGLASLYQSLDTLAPAAVFLDDIDLLAGDRRNGNPGAMLREFLTHLDGLSPAASVITVATTNASTTIDPALIRPGRFDAVIEVSAPDRGARAEILRRLLAPIAEVDVDELARVTEGATGADLREMVRRTVLERGADIGEQQLLDVVRTGRWQAAPPAGQYL